MHGKRIKHLEYVLLFILTLVGVIGYFYSDYTSSGGGYYPNVFFLIFSIIYFLVTFLLLLGNFKSDFVGFIVISPISVLIVDYAMNGYQMFNIYPFFLLIITMFLSFRVHLKLNFLFINNIFQVFLFYIYSLMSIFVAIITTGSLSDTSTYWLLIIIPLITFIISLAIYSFHDSGVNKTYIINYIYKIYLTLGLVMIGRIIYYSFTYGNGVTEVFKRIFSFPTMSTSNYTFAVMAILFLYIYANKEFISIRAIRFSQLLFLIIILLSQSRGGLMAFAVVISYIFIENFLFLLSKVSKGINIRRIFISITILVLVSFIGLLLNEKLINILSNINIVQRIGISLNGYDNNTTSRLGYWKMYWDDYKDGSFLEILFGNGLSTSVNQIVRRPHNIYFLVLNQLGIFGLFMFITCWLRVVFKIKKLKYVVIYLLVHAFVEPLFLTVWIDTLIILFLFIESLSETKKGVNKSKLYHAQKHLSGIKSS